jgi:adenine phosphoribosyltransferase
MAHNGLGERVLGVVRDVPDFPQPGIVFKDLAPLYADPALFAEVRDWIVDVAPDATCVAGIEARGFLLGAPAALAAKVPFTPVRKAGKLPGPCHALSYDLEYGAATLEVQVGGLAEGARVLVVDDVLATGGTARATCALVEACGASVSAVVVLLELGFLRGRRLLDPHPVHSLAVV